MESIGGDGSDVHPWIPFALALCETLRGRPGCYVSPEIPAKVVDGAVRSYFRFHPDELILVVVDRSAGSSPLNGCVLTTRRIHWSARATGSGGPPAPTEGHSGAPLTREAESWGRSLEYRALPELVEAHGPLPLRLDLGDRRELPLPGLDAPTIEAVAGALTTLRRGACTGDIAGAVSPEAIARARARFPAVVRREEAVRQAASGLASFHMQARAATPHVVVFRLIMAACVLVFLAMIGTGISPMDPEPEQLLRWGGNLGASVALDGQTWRLLTSMFLHANLIHLAVNMLCLYQAGPLVERLYGNLGFALLYLASGIGGSLASAWAHPRAVGVGASGAIFGLFGGLLAFLLVHRARIPASVLRPMRSGVGTFVVFNALLGFASPQIDNAAHLGGLATGFLAGLLLTRPWPTPRPTTGLIRQLALGALLLAGLWLAAGPVSARIRANPEVASLEAEIRENELMQRLRPLLARFDQLNSGLGSLLAEIQKTSPDDPGSKRTLEGLISDARKNQSDLSGLPAEGEELKAMRASVVAAQTDLVKALQALRRYLDAPQDDAAIDGPEGFAFYLDRSQRETRRFLKLRDDYLKKHDPVPSEPGPGG